MKYRPLTQTALLMRGGTWLGIWNGNGCPQLNGWANYHKHPPDPGQMEWVILHQKGWLNPSSIFTGPDVQNTLTKKNPNERESVTTTYTWSRFINLSAESTFIKPQCVWFDPSYRHYITWKHFRATMLTAESTFSCMLLTYISIVWEHNWRSWPSFFLHTHKHTLPRFLSLSLH